MALNNCLFFCHFFRQSVDFVAATQDNLSQAPYIVPNSPTEKEQSKCVSHTD